jgi:hypothetical protein
MLISFRGLWIYHVTGMRTKKLVVAIMAGFTGAVAVFALTPRFRPICQVLETKMSEVDRERYTVAITLWRPTDGVFLVKDINFGGAPAAAEFSEHWIAAKGQWVDCRLVPDSIYPIVLLDSAVSQNIRYQNALFILLLISVLLALIYHAHKNCEGTQEANFLPPPPYEAPTVVSRAP